MSIKSYAGINQTLQNYNTRDWTKSVEGGSDLGNISKQLKEAGIVDGQKSFGDMLTDSISKVNDLQLVANTAMEKIASGESKNLHETMLAVEKAEIAFRTMNKVRSKVLDAYKDIMKMQV